jgi:uncharacterized protein (TIGR02147 family)
MVADSKIKLSKKNPVEPQVLDFLSGVEFLRRLYAFRKHTQLKYTYRVFANDLGFGQTNYLHLICSGERGLSAKAASQMANHLDFSARESRFFEVLAKYESAKTSAERDLHFNEILALKGKLLTSSLSQAQLRYFSDWQHAAIREMVRLPEFQADAQWIASRLCPRLTPLQAKESWQLLLDLGYVAMDSSSGKWKQSEQNIVVPEGATSVAIFRFQQGMADLGKESLTRVPSQLRDVSSLTLPADPKLLFEIKEQLHILKSRFLEQSDEIAEPTEVYQLNLQLFPLTMKDKKS